MSIPFISDVYADTAAATTQSPAGSGLSTIIMVVVFFAIFYFLLIRPQSKRNKELRAMIESLKKGDEVVTAGGILGRITNIDDNIITLAINDTTEIKVQKSAVSSILPKGSLKE